MADAAKKRATYADVLAVPSHLVAEITDGELVTSPRPSPRHARAASILGGELIGPFDRGIGGPGGWWITLREERPWLTRTLADRDPAELRESLLRMSALAARFPDLAIVPAHDARAFAALPSP